MYGTIIQNRDFLDFNKKCDGLLNSIKNMIYNNIAEIKKNIF